MFIIYDPKKQRVPIKVWLENIVQLEYGCLKQATNLSTLPFVNKWVALMPDTHQGYGMPIGGVIAVEDAIIPNAVGVDIGCGMAFVETNINKNELSTQEYQALIGRIMRDIPTGFDHHAKKQKCTVLEQSEFAKAQKQKTLPEGLPEIEEGYYQIGTLGGGNHFIELQEDEAGRLCIMVHSGSRNFGYKVARYFNSRAKQLNEKWSSPVPREFDLAFLPIDSDTAQEYIAWMTLALQFARENRTVMLNVVKRHLLQVIPNIEFQNEVNAHHNYAAAEHHYGKQVWVHRKGAIRARKGETGIIPGAMGTFSYIVKGKGNPESFCSCSHGAGRRMGRQAAKRQFPVAKTIADLKELGVILGKRNKKDVSEEARFAYKDIDFVISQELDLIAPIKKLKTIAVIKG
ncbi:MAG TPA: RtcB family protein [Firmicutes bacterium]|jgi:tRNA-splicing ligase RtcB|nr:RtcB family protein [Bacillota bacterium]